MSSTQPSYGPQWTDPSPDFSCASCADGPGFTRVTLCGELDLATAPQLADALANAPDGAAVVILDLSGLTFMDSTGIRVILRAEQHARMHGAELVVVRPPDAVMRVLELVGLDEQLELVESG